MLRIYEFSVGSSVIKNRHNLIGIPSQENKVSYRLTCYPSKKEYKETIFPDKILLYYLNVIYAKYKGNVVHFPDYLCFLFSDVISKRVFQNDSVPFFIMIDRYDPYR